MRKKKFRKSGIIRISLRTFITILIIVLSALILYVYSALTDRMNSDKYAESLIQDISMECRMMSRLIVEQNFIVEDNSSLDMLIESMSNHFYGRIIIIDDEYRIVDDTFGSDTRGYMVNDTVIDVMTGKESSSVSKSDDYIEYICPITDSDDNVCGVMLVNASTQYIDKISYSVRKKNVLFSTIIMLISVAAAFLIGNLSTRGIKKINRQIEAAKDGHLDEKLPEQGFLEFKMLTKSYNDTIGRLMVLDSTRQEFVSNVSHELKTPITSMKVLADSLIQNESADLSMYKEFMVDIVDEIDRESKIITDLLTLVKMDKKSAEMNIEEVDINALLEIILKRVSPIAASRGIEISYESYRDVTAEVDEVKLSLALTNIIENAVKYNVDNGWVKVTLNSDHRNVHIKVADSGVGIPEDCKEQVFERFYRVDKARSRDTGGTGLGLAITKNVIMMHRGTIKLYSEYGEGTTFTIKVPIKYMEEKK